MRRVLFPIIFILCIGLTFLVYMPGLNGPFIFDDTPNITKNPAVAINDLSIQSLKQAMFSSSSGMLKRPISMLSFSLNYFVSGFDPYYFKLTNVIIHFAVGLGIFILTILLLDVYRKQVQPALSAAQTYWISLAVAGAWLLHPFNLTSVLYVVQRMTSLSALFMVWGLVMYVWGRMRLQEEKSGLWHILSSFFIFTPLAMLCKENGALLPMLLLIIEATLFKFQNNDPKIRRFIKGIFAFTIVLPALFMIGYIALHPHWLPSMYIGRDFTLSERLMTETRVIWFYIRLILLPSVSQMGLFHDDIVISTGLLQPVSTLFSIVGLLTLLLISFLLRKKAPLVTLGILFFFAGHILESTVIPLEITHEHRNYLAMYGLLLPLFFHLLQPVQYISTLTLRRVTAILFIGLFAFNTFARASQWTNPFDFAQIEVTHHPDSPRNNSEMGTVYASIQSVDPIAMDNNYLQARYYFERTISLNPHYMNGLFNLIILSSKRNKNVAKDWIIELTKRVEHSPITPNAGDSMVALVDCQIKQICKLKVNEIEELFAASLRNHTLLGSIRAKVLSAKILYLIHVKKDYSAAIIAMHQAIEASPNELEYRLALIDFLLLLQKNEEARVQLAILKPMDKLQVYHAKIESFERDLSSQTKSEKKIQ